ncbi:MAG TPA: hypothetical protein VG892_00035 [Terriglobales bacterium]|jgi:hypothetical protein|nr:hypothetical protein [Terriglobales bacterium]
MLRASSVILVVVLFCGAIAFPQSSLGTQSLAGTWKLNLEKSKYRKDDPGSTPQSATMVIRQIENGVNVMVSALIQGEEHHVQFDLVFDGKDRPVLGAPRNSEFGFGDPMKDTVSAKKLDRRTFLVTRKQSDMPVSTQKIVLSADGRSRTSYWKSKNEKGEPIDWVSVFDKQ